MHWLGLVGAPGKLRLYMEMRRLVAIYCTSHARLKSITFNDLFFALVNGFEDAVEKTEQVKSTPSCFP